MIKIKQAELDEFKAKCPENVRATIQKFVESLNEAVNIIEGVPPLTKGWYDVYLPLIKTKHDFIFFFFAGANRVGIEAAAKLNGIHNEK